MSSAEASASMRLSNPTNTSAAIIAIYHPLDEKWSPPELIHAERKTMALTTICPHRYHYLPHWHHMNRMWIIDQVSYHRVSTTWSQRVNTINLDYHSPQTTIIPVESNDPAQ
eukprot:516431_1